MEKLKCELLQPVLRLVVEVEVAGELRQPSFLDVSWYLGDNLLCCAFSYAKFREEAL